MRPWKVIERPNGQPIEVYTNHHSYDLISGFELTAEERAEFDHLSESTIEEGTFFRHRDRVYFEGDFMPCKYATGWSDPPKWMADLGFDGYLTDGFFSVMCIRYIEDGMDTKVRVYTCIA